MLNITDLFANTSPLTGSTDLSQAMIAGLHHFFERKTAESVAGRAAHWNRQPSSPQAYCASIRENRRRFARLIGLKDEREVVEMQQVSRAGGGESVDEQMIFRRGGPACPPWPKVIHIRGGHAGPPLPPHQRGLRGSSFAARVSASGFRIQRVRWNVLEGIEGEGLLLTPLPSMRGRVIALPDADQTPEQVCGLEEGIAPASQFARRLAANGFQVLVPALVNRDCRYSCSPAIGQTNLSHREWIYRQAFEMARHIIGLEILKIQAGVDWFEQQEHNGPVGVAGYGEGGLLALYAGAVDERIRAVWVSGYFKPRQTLWQEPIERNVWGLLTEFGDAEIASLVAPRALVVEYAPEPTLKNELPPAGSGEVRQIAARGVLSTPSFDEVQAEFERIASLVGAELQPRSLFGGPQGAALPFGRPDSLSQFARELSGGDRAFDLPQLSELLPRGLILDANPHLRQKRLVSQMERFLQELVRDAELTRGQSFLERARLDSLENFRLDTGPLRQQLWEEVIGRLDEPMPDCHPRVRLVYEQETWLGYEIVLDVWKDVFAWGILCLPRNLQPGEKRPVVVCQHGLEGLPRDTIELSEDGQKYYHQFAARLAERGFITFAPHNPYRGGETYRQVQRRANPLRASIGSVIIAQHTQILRWLASLAVVDAQRMAFYGLSYGGWTAMHVAPILEEYCLAICSANFNDWIRKVTSLGFSGSYMGDSSFEMCEWDAGSTFSHAEAAGLIAPRPFMVERGMHDSVAPDAWVAGEYAKVRWLYQQLGIAERTEIEFFNGEHEIHSQGTFEFLHRQLNWPAPGGQGRLDLYMIN